MFFSHFMSVLFWNLHPIYHHISMFISVLIQYLAIWPILFWICLKVEIWNQPEVVGFVWWSTKGCNHFLSQGIGLPSDLLKSDGEAVYLFLYCTTSNSHISCITGHIHKASAQFISLQESFGFDSPISNKIPILKGHYTIKYACRVLLVWMVLFWAALLQKVWMSGQWMGGGEGKSIVSIYFWPFILISQNGFRGQWFHESLSRSHLEIPMKGRLDI